MVAVPFSCGIQRRPSISATAPIGTLIRNSQRQDSECSISPPRNGPIAGASTTATPSRAITRPSLPGPTAWPRTVCPAGTSSPAVSPCRTRRPMRTSIDGAAAHSAEITVKAASAPSQSLPTPTRLPSQAQPGRDTARASRYALETHWATRRPVPNSSWTVFSAMLISEVSRPLANAPNATTQASRQVAGLISDVAAADFVSIPVMVPLPSVIREVQRSLQRLQRSLL
ncbi:hypothetical protein SCOCK_10334 [Actinacidiphila cocklensis]|uniref:Uncharacterized protein n=1 Tax=Actinacidiphila cocklensis TaxID=887465 RepID=A0A9W4GN39_9ACTN|nr:hypothetical protein SCOCK_10334 [Actinacidiphila cocklensis]